jgi:hypothetical protein
MKAEVLTHITQCDWVTRLNFITVFARLVENSMFHESTQRFGNTCFDDGYSHILLIAQIARDMPCHEIVDSRVGLFGRLRSINGAVGSSHPVVV